MNPTPWLKCSEEFLTLHCRQASDLDGFLTHLLQFRGTHVAQEQSQSLLNLRIVTFVEKSMQGERLSSDTMYLCISLEGQLHRQLDILSSDSEQ